MNENLLPPAVLGKASVRGDEYAWRLSDLEEVIKAAQVCNLATVGGQAQFRVPDGTCEMYWICAEPAQRTQDESWSHYVQRSASEMLSQIRLIIENTDFQSEASKWPLLLKRMQQGEEILKYLCFVLDFEANKHDMRDNKGKGENKGEATAL
jgi:hypothetical protein